MDDERAGVGSHGGLDGAPPLIAGRIHGVRTWSVTWASGGRAALTGFGGYGWEPDGRPTRAVCANGTGGGSLHAPGPDCGCGLYALHPFTDGARHLSFGPPAASECFGPFGAGDVGGVVEAWGRAELHADGFRAEYARPIALVVFNAWEDSEYATLVGRLADRYRAEVLSLEDPTELAPHCEQRGLGLAKPTVRALMRERPRPAPRRAEPIPEPADDEEPGGWLSRLWEEWRPESILDGLGMLVGAVFGLAYVAFWGAIAYAVAATIFGWFPEDDEPQRGERPALHGKRSLEIVDEEVVHEGGRRWLYLAKVTNTGRRAAIGVVPSGRLLDRNGERIGSIDRPGAVEGAANLAPGGTGVVWDSVRIGAGERRIAPAGIRIKVVAGARRLAQGPQRPPVEVRSVRLDRDLCIVTAVIDSRREMGRARIALVGRDPRGRALGAGTVQIGPLSRGRDRYFMTRIPPWACRRPGVGLEAHASLTARQLLGPRGR